MASNPCPTLNRNALATLLSAVVEIGFLVWLGCMRGQERANDFGSAPGIQKAVEVF